MSRRALVGLAIGGLLAGCGGGGAGGAGTGGGRGGDGGAPSAGDAGYVSGGGAVTEIPPAEREAAPAMSGRTLDDEPIALSDFTGQVVVLNIWGSWCPPCRKEAPELVELANRQAGKGIVVVGVNTRDGDQVPARRFVETYDVPYPSFYDPDGELLLGFSGTIPPNAIPSTLIIDRQGRVAARVIGESTRRTFEQLALDVAAEDRR